MRTLPVVSMAMLAVFACGCPAPMTGPPGSPFTLSVPPPDRTDPITIEQGGEALFEVGSALVHYEIQMSGSSSGESMTMEVEDLPTGVFLPESELITLSDPFSLEPGALRNGFFTIWANDAAVPGTYTVTLTVSGLFSPDSTPDEVSDTFALTVTERP